MTHLALQAVAELIRTQTMRIEYDGIPDLTVQLRAPCLLAQLASLVGVGLESGGRGIPGSRPTINVDAVDLWVEIATATATWCQQLGIDRTALRDPPPAEDDVHTTPAVGKLLRSCAADAISRGFPQIADRIAHNATAWARRIDTMLTGHTEQRAVRGAGCPDCTTIAPYPRGQIGPWAGPQPTRTITEYRDENGRQARPDAVRQASNQDLVRVALHPRPDPRAELACRPDVLQRLARRTRLRRQPRRTRLDARSSPRRPASPSRRGAVTFGRERAVTDPDLHTLAAEAPD